MLSTVVEVAGLACLALAAFLAFGVAPGLGVAGAGLLFVGFALSQEPRARRSRVGGPLTNGQVDVEQVAERTVRRVLADAIRQKV